MAYTLDNLARDIAFEINFGGDRFDHKDVEANLEGIGEESLMLFRKRVMYHAEDFKPASMTGQMSFPRWMDRQLDVWLGGVKTAEELGRSYDAVPFARDFGRLRFDRGKWFSLSDGSGIKCTRATIANMIAPDEMERLKPEETTLLSLLKKGADRLLDKYGEEVRRDGWWDSLTFSDETVSLFPETRLSLMRQSNKIGSERVSGGYCYCVLRESPEGNDITMFSDMPVDLQEYYYWAVGNEFALRNGWKDDLRRAAEGLDSSGEDRSVPLDESVSVLDPETGRKRTVDTLYLDPEGNVWVGDGRRSGNGFSRRLDGLSPKEVSDIRKATGKTMRMIMEKTAGPRLDSIRRQDRAAAPRLGL